MQAVVWTCSYVKWSRSSPFVSEMSRKIKQITFLKPCVVFLVSPMNTPYLFACLHVLVSCVYASCSPYIHRRPALMPTQSSEQETVTMTYMCEKKFLACNLKFPTKESVSIFSDVCFKNQIYSNST